MLTETKTMESVWPQFLLFGKREYIPYGLFWIPIAFVFQRTGWGKKGKKAVL
jgi:hypothetical protein